MPDEKKETISRLTIDPQKKTQRRGGGRGVVFWIMGFILIGVIFFMVTKHGDRKPVPLPTKQAETSIVEQVAADVALTVSGYVIPRERIEISPRFQGTVTWIGVKKGDVVKAGDVLVQLDDAEYRSRVTQEEGRLQLAEVNLANAQITHERQRELTSNKVDSVQALDDARRALEAAQAELTMAKGQLDLAKTYLEWCTIRAPIDGIILEKLVNPNELVVPVSFGSGQGPSTAFLAMADLNDLQVEIDLNEADTPKVHLNQLCRVTPEAYPDHVYEGRVAEIAPEANRAKGTLQVKVQIEKPDRFLTPELTAKVDFLKEN